MSAHPPGVHGLHVLIATDGSTYGPLPAHFFGMVIDPLRLGRITIVGVVPPHESPLSHSPPVAGASKPARDDIAPVTTVSGLLSAIQYITERVEVLSP